MIQFQTKQSSFEEQKKSENILITSTTSSPFTSVSMKKVEKPKKIHVEKNVSQKDVKVPGIRFSGFTDDWEQRKLLLICDFEKGRGLSKDNIDNNAISLYFVWPIIYRLWNVYKYCLF